MLEFSTHEAAREVSQKMRDGTQTAVTYKRVYDNYRRFMEHSEFEKKQLDPDYECIPAEPITAANVAAFVKFESSREKVRAVFCHAQKFRGDSASTSAQAWWENLWLHPQFKRWEVRDRPDDLSA